MPYIYICRQAEGDAECLRRSSSPPARRYILKHAAMLPARASRALMMRASSQARPFRRRLRHDVLWRAMHDSAIYFHMPARHAWSPNTPRDAPCMQGEDFQRHFRRHFRSQAYGHAAFPRDFDGVAHRATGDVVGSRRDFKCHFIFAAYAMLRAIFMR